MKPVLLAIVLFLTLTALSDDSDTYAFVLADRLEYATNSHDLTLDFKAWWGNDNVIGCR